MLNLLKKIDCRNLPFDNVKLSSTKLLGTHNICFNPQNLYEKDLSQTELDENNEPTITDKVIKGLLAPTCGIINPFELVVAAMENAMDNGVELNLLEEVISRGANPSYVGCHKANYKNQIIKIKTDR